MSPKRLEIMGAICVLASLSCMGLMALDVTRLFHVRPSSPDVSRGYTRMVKTSDGVFYVSDDEYTGYMLFLLGAVVCGMPAAPLIYLAKKREAAASAE